ncbi:MAG: hypothetical protein ABFS37_11600 [Acidobacteriota bacterium]
MRKRRIVLAAVVLVLLVGVVVVVWQVNDWPPPRLILKHGFPPTGGPTGRTWTTNCGIEFVEISRGYHHAHCRVWSRPGTWFGRLAAALGFPLRSSPIESSLSVDRWVESEHDYWISRHPVWLLREGDVSHRADSRGLPALLQCLDRHEHGRFRIATVDEVRRASWEGAQLEGLDPSGIYHPGPRISSGRGDHAVGHQWRDYEGTGMEILYPRTGSPEYGTRRLNSDRWRSVDSVGPIHLVVTDRTSEGGDFLVWTPSEDE